VPTVQFKLLSVWILLAHERRRGVHFNETEVLILIQALYILPMAREEALMSIHTVNISFPSELLAKADRVAKREARSRSELVREALRIYIERQVRWEAIFGMGEEKQKASGFTEADVAREIRAHRAAKRKRS